MNYRTEKTLTALHQYLLEEPCNESLDLSIFLHIGWPVSELKETVWLLRKLIHTPGLTQSQLRAEGFSPSMLKQTLTLLPEELMPSYSNHNAEGAINHLFDQSHPIIQALTESQYTLHRLHPDGMKVSVAKGFESIHLEWMMVKHQNQMFGWIILPKP